MSCCKYNTENLDFVVSWNDKLRSGRMDEAIYNAVQMNEPGLLRDLLDAGGDVNEFYQDLTLISDKSILHMCCEKGRIECVKVLIEKGANLNVQDTWYQTPLMYCMLTQYHEIADMLLEADPDIIDVGDKYGKKAIHIAVEVGSLDGIKVLIKYGCDVNGITDYGFTALMTACSDKQSPPEVVLEIVNLLLEHGANCNMACYRSRRTALQMAIATKKLEVVELLLSAGSNPSTIDSSGRCPITNLLWYHHRAQGRGVIDDDVMMMIVMVIQSGADLNLHKYEDTNPLCMATLYRCSSLVAYLLDCGASQNCDFYCGTTPLQIAVRNRDLLTMKILLNWKSNLYRKGRVIRGDQDYTADAFHLAMDIGSFDAAILLAEVGYNLSRVHYLVDWSQIPPHPLIENPTMLDFFRQSAISVHSLFRLGVFAIRRTFTGHISNSADQLPLPKILIDNIKIKYELT